MRSGLTTLGAAVAVAAGCAFVIRGLNVALRSGETITWAETHDGLPPLSIIVPARNEERQIEECVRSLLAQRYADFEIIVVDDRSHDATPHILAAIARDEPRLRIVAGKPLPDGWIGKPWALAQGVRSAHGSWLLFTDADTVHEPNASASAVRYALGQNGQAVSLLPTQRFESLAERAILPTILWMIAFAVGSLEAINDPSRLDAAIFNGQYVLFDRAAYEALGGHASVRASIAEDYDLARAIKRDGRFRTRLAGAGGLVQTRMYRSFAELWNGFSKNLYVAAEDRPAAAVAGIAALLAISPLPELVLARALRHRRYGAALACIAAIAATAATAEFGMRRSLFPRWSGLCLPLGAPAMAAIFANSLLRHRTGSVAWRGRTYGQNGGRAGRAREVPKPQSPYGSPRAK